MVLRPQSLASLPSLAPVPLILSRLSLESQAMLRQLLNSVPAPIDACCLADVVQVAVSAIETYQDSLPTHNDTLCNLSAALKCLAGEVSANALYLAPLQVLNFPLFRRLSTYPVWGLLIEIGKGRIEGEIQVLVGAELALSLVMRKPFRKSFAIHLLSDLAGPRPAPTPDTIPVWQKKAVRIRREADGFFWCSGDNPAQAASVSSSNPFATVVARWFRARIEFARDKDHQCVLDHRSQTVRQMQASASELRNRIAAGDESAMAIVLAVLAGIPAPLILALPLAGPHIVEWVMVLDVGDGCLKTAMDLFAPGRARPAEDRSDPLKASGEVIVKPLPMFLAEALLGKLSQRPNAKTVGELLPVGQVTARDITVSFAPGNIPGLRPSAARLANGFGPMAVQLGVDRYLAALLSNDPRLIPTGKFFYALAGREEIWQAAQTTYDHAGWGCPAPFVDGLPVGSRVVPERTTVTRWYGWMLEQLESDRPGRRYTLASLLRHHNIFAHCAASLLSFGLALRERQSLPLLASVPCVGTTVAINDKAVGWLREARPVPIAPTIANQIEHWLVHCRELDRRLEKLELAPSCHCRARLSAILSGQAVPLFFTVGGRRKAKAMASHDLAQWWPSELGLAPNFARHFWQNALRDAGLSSPAIDAFVRHSLRGDDPSASTSLRVTADWASEIAQAVERVLGDLEIFAFTGLKGKD